MNEVNDCSRRTVFARVGVACDHGGYPLKEEICAVLRSMGIEYGDLGTDSGDSVDYPDYARRLAGKVAAGELDAGILICGTGIGMAMAANKIPGVRAAVCSEPLSTRLTREHNDANILAIGARIVGPALAEEMVRCFCTTPFSGGRHARRVEKIAELERDSSQCEREV